MFEFLSIIIIITNKANQKGIKFVNISENKRSMYLDLRKHLN